jgi:threonine/homoserine/homoserine lactone efflux protein
MDPLITLVTVFAVFVPALMLPGPDFVAVVRSAMAHGSRAGLATTVGVTAGLTLYATLSLVGLSALLVEYQWLTWLVRVLGGGYLVFLGVRLLLTRAPAADDPAEADAAMPPPPAGRALVFGFLVTLTNPKAIVLFASVFATAVTPTTPVWLLGLMVALVAAAAFAWYAMVSLFMASAPVMRRFRRTGARHPVAGAATP